MNTARAGGIALSVFAIATMAWFALELAPPLLGYADTDDPAVSLSFLRDHSVIYALSGLALFTMAVSILVGAIAMGDRLTPPGSLAGRVSVAIGFGSALFFFGHGVLRSSVGPLLHIDSLDQGWGESAYLSIQMGGLHAFAQGGIVAFCTWAVIVSVAGVRGGSIPRWIAVLAVLPAFRLGVSLLGPIGVLETLDGLWPFAMASIVGSMLWPLGLGLWLAFAGHSGRAARPVIASGSP